MARIELKARRGGHCLALPGHAAGMLEEMADVPGFQHLVVDLQFIEESAQMRAHIAPRVAIGAAADPQHAVRRVGLQREITAFEAALVRRSLPCPST